MEGSEEHFDESEHVDDLAEEERSTDGEDGFGEEMDETRASEREGCRSSEGSDCAAEEGYEEDGRGPEGSDFAAEEDLVLHRVHPRSRGVTRAPVRSW